MSFMIGLYDPVRDPHNREASISGLERYFREAIDICSSIGLHVSALHGRDVLELLALRDPGLTGDTAERAAMAFSSNVKKEASLKLFFSLSPEKAKMFSQREPFGPVVAERFPSATFDIEEAVRCYALNRSTACVMHLMRVLEAGLAVFGPAMNVATQHKDWGRILSEIEKAVTSIESSNAKPPGWKDDREFNFQCIADFRVFKNAWRNASMHGRGKYGDEEAMDIMNRVRSFMQALSRKFSEASDTQ